jgi:broad specificity polyphosphatase/5'/3'-nucleotidase SurE
LLDFFKGTVAGAGNTAFSTLKAQAISQSMKMLEPLSKEEVKRWLQYWKKEFLAY